MNGLTAVQAGRSGIIRITGSAGSGKTRLLTHSTTEASRRGIKVYHASADRSGAYASLAPLLDTLMFDKEPLLDDREIRRLRQSQGQQFWLLKLIEAGLEDASQRRPIIISIDDLQWCDDLTLMALRAIPSRLAALPILWIVTSREDFACGQVSRTASALKDAATATIALEPLSSVDIALIAREMLGATPDEAVSELASRTDGSPLQIFELFKGLVDEGSVECSEGVAWLLRDDVPMRFKDLISARAQRLSASASKYLHIAATLGHRFDPADLAQLVDDSPAALLGPLQEAIDAGFLIEQPEGLSFRHELVRECLENALPMSLRRGLARRVVDLRVLAGAAPHDAADAVALCAEPGDLAAVEILRKAARTAGPRDILRAVAWVEEALRLLPDFSEQWAEVALEGSTLMHTAGHSDRARAVATKGFERSLAPDVEAQLLLVLGNIDGRTDLKAGSIRYRQAAAVPGVSSAQSMRVSVDILDAGCSEGDLGPVAEFGSETLRDAIRHGDQQSERRVREHLAQLAVSRMNWVAGLEVLTGSESHAGIAAKGLDVKCLRLLSASGRRRQAVNAIDEQLSSSANNVDVPRTTLRRSSRARLLLEAGKLLESETEAHRAIVGSGLSDLGAAELTDARLALAHVALHTGDSGALGEARITASTLIDADTAAGRTAGTWLSALMADSVGDVPLATELAGRVFDQIAPAESLSMQPSDDPILVQILLNGHDVTRATEVVERAERRAELNTDFSSFSAHATLARGILESDAARIAESTQLLAAEQSPLSLAMAHESLAALLTVRDPHHAARELEAALEIYETTGSGRGAARVRRSLRGVGVRKHDSTPRTRQTVLGLTVSEQRVVDLVANGVSNREAAVRLSLSIHTVSTHLRHAFEKLGVNSRVELARLLDEHEQTA